MYFQYYINHHLSQYEDQDKDKERTYLNVNTVSCRASHTHSELFSMFRLKLKHSLSSPCFLKKFSGICVCKLKSAQE